MLLHEPYCLRNIHRCPKCGEFVDRRDESTHQQDFHELAECKFCKQSKERWELARHEPTCESRPKECSYCENAIPGTLLEAHRKICGSKTNHCENCKQYVMRRDWEKHQRDGCDLIVSSEAKKSVPHEKPVEEEKNKDKGKEEAKGKPAQKSYLVSSGSVTTV